jgi:hypothetical protein
VFHFGARCSGGKGLVLPFLFHRTGFEIVQRFRWAHQRHRRDQPGDLIAGTDGFAPQRIARHVQMVGMAENILHNIFGHAAFTQHGRAVLWVLFQRWVDLPIEIVQQPHQSPGFHIFAELFGIEAHGHLHRKHVAHQSFVLHIFTHQR